MTETERALLEMLGDWFNQFGLLPEEHPADLLEAQFHIHALQNIVLSRPGLREMKKRTL